MLSVTWVTCLSCESPSRPVAAVEEALYEYDIEEKLSELGIVLEEQKMPPGLKIEMANQVDNMVYLSGNGPMRGDGVRVEGKVGKDLTIEEGYVLL